MSRPDQIVIVGSDPGVQRLSEVARELGIDVLVIGAEEAKKHFAEPEEHDRDEWRRRRAECLANLHLESEIGSTSFEDLSDPAARIAEALGGSARIYIYDPSTGRLSLSGAGVTQQNGERIGRFAEYLRQHPYRVGEGLPGTVFQIGRPLQFSDTRGRALVDFVRDDEERALVTAIGETTLIATPIESYGERTGVLVVGRVSERGFDAEDLDFTRAVAERIGAASHMHRLTRIALEGHRAAEELARQEVDARLRFEAVLENAPIAIAVLSADELRFELANVRWVEFVGRFGRLGAGRNLTGMRATEVIPDFVADIKQAADRGETRIDEAYELADEHGTVLVNRIISPVRGRLSGATQSITVLVQDVTTQVRAKAEIEALAEQMAERSARLDSILHSMADALWVYDGSGNVVDVNPAALTLFGIGSRTEAIARGSLEALTLRYTDGRPIPSEDYPQARALRGEVVPDYLAIGRHLLTGKDVDLSIAAAPIESGGIVGAVLVMRDISGLQELDRKKDEFLSVASHELRTPLTTIKGYAQLLQQTVSDLSPEDSQTYLAAMLGEVDRMMGLISELLDVSRIETNRLLLHRQPTRWSDFIEARASAFRVQNPEREIRIRSELAGEVVQIDVDRMRQVIDNLISNAVKYSPDASPIDVTTSRDGTSVVTQVIDHGIGIPPDEIPRLFDRFHRARNVSSRYYGGLGLGLYIAHAIVLAHGGTITVESDEGRGSRFTLRLPYAG